MTPTVDKRDGYRADVDRQVTYFGGVRKWSAAQLGKAKRICYRTIWTESDWRNLANPSVPDSIKVVPNDGFGKDLDSTGLYQQRASQGWGSVEGSMDPYVATGRFLTVMLQEAPNWLTDNEAATCQRVQRSQYDGVKFPFAANYQARQEQTDAIAADLKYFTNHGGN